ncbi:MAG: zinc-dependent metalloprotease [Balneolaceae bacterium]
MRQSLTLILLMFLLPLAASAQDDRDKQFNKMIEGAEKIEGFFDFYRTSNKLYMAVKAEQVGMDFLLNYQVARGIGAEGLYGGRMLNVFESNVVSLEVRENKVFLVNKPHRYTAAAGTPQDRAVDLTYGESVLEVAGVDAVHSDGYVLIDVYNWFVGDLSEVSRHVKKAVSGRAAFDRNRSYLDLVESFPENSNVQANLTFRNQENSGPRTVADHRYVPVSIFYSMSKLPEEPMEVRKADDRIGYFLTAQKDFTETDEDFFRRYVNRWRLECEGPRDEEGLCVPKEPVVYYLENTIPERYRQPMMEGVEAWNAAFEEAGFRDAIRAEMLPDSINAGDIRYATLRWNVSDKPGYGAIGPSSVDPRTGEILDANILFEASMFQGFRDTYSSMVDPKQAIDEIYIQSEDEMELMQQGIKTDAFFTEMGTQVNLTRAALLMQGDMKPGDEMPDEYVDQATRWVTMHEVGHTLGLRHNFRSSTDTPLDKLYDIEWTTERGVYSSVMDYPSPNISGNAAEQGQYYNVGIGTYDRWAISYGYIPDGEKAGEIARRSAEPGHAYGTDEDARGAGAIDPTINAYSLGEDPLAWGRGRADLIRTMLPVLPQIAMADNMPYYEVSNLFQSIFFQYARAIAPTVKYIGGQYQYRDHRGDPNARRPFEAIPLEKQEDALNTIVNYAFSIDAVDLPQEVYQQFGANRWNHWGVSNTWQGRIDFPIHKTLLGVQNSLLSQLLHPVRLERIRDTELKFGAENTVTIPRLMSRLTEAIWSESWESPGTNTSSTRRDLQRSHLDAMIRIVTDAPSGMPADARSVARTNLLDLQQRLEQRLEPPAYEFDEYTRAHLLESRERIRQAMDAGFDLEN